MDEIAKYAETSEKTKARACFLSIPKHLAKDYKKFRYSLVAPSGSSRKYEGSLMWLYDAGIINFCYNLLLPKLPFEGNSRSEAFGAEVKRRIILGTYVLSSGYYDAYYKKAQKVRTLIKKEFEKLFEKYDVLLTPTSPSVAYEVGSKCNNPLEMYLADLCTVTVNIAGLPGISVPCGVDRKGMPIGMQLIGKHFDEETIIRAAYTYEQETKFRENYKPEFKS